MKLTKGHMGQRHHIYRRAHESLIHALQYAFAHRRERKGDMRRLWIVRINAAARAAGLSYSQLMVGLKRAGVALNRKVLADLAITDPGAFSRLVDIAKSQGQLTTP